MRYSRKLVNEDVVAKHMTLEKQNENAEIQKMQQRFSLVLTQWSLHPDSAWRSSWIQKAEQYKDKIPNAKLILDLKESKGSL